MTIKAAFWLILPYVVIAADENPHQDIVQQGVTLVQEGLKTYPHIDLHLQLPTHQDLTRIETWIRENVPSYVETFLTERLSRVKTIVEQKESTVDALSFLPSSFTTDEIPVTSVKVGLASVMETMLLEMEKGLGSLDFEIDDAARTSLGDVYFYVKAMITSNLQKLKECPDNCGFSHTIIIKTLGLLKTTEDEMVKKLVSIILGVPGLDTKFIRPQLIKIRSSMPEIDESVFQFLLALGEWLNDVLNSGLLGVRQPFNEIRSELLEMLGSTKDKIVPRLQDHLKILDERKESLDFVTEMFTTVVKKYFGNF